MTPGLLLLAVLTTTCVFAGRDDPGRVYIDKGACPFEGCAYREWTARRDVSVRKRPGESEIVDRIRRGERVQAITGEVHCRPVRMVATRDHPEPGSYEPTAPAIRKGDVYYLLHYIGEGQWQVWFRGKLNVVEEFKQAPRAHAIWWAKVKTARGTIGWVLAEGNFAGQDMLAAMTPASPSRGE